MPMVNILAGGNRVYVPAPPSFHTREKRKTCQGWTLRVSRNLTKFLQSIDPSMLEGRMLAVTLTVKDCPPDARAWHQVRRRFEMRMQYQGVQLWTWLTEWQRRQIPHIHGMLVFPHDSTITPEQVTRAWIQAAAEFGPLPFGQDCRPVDRIAGWFEYLGKHAARSVWNYQRSPTLIPPGWQGKTGRMWGKSGDWPIQDGKMVDVPWPVWHQFRRLCIRYQIAKARRQGDRRRIAYVRGFLRRQPDDSTRSTALPGSWWMPEDISWSLLGAAHAKLDNLPG